MGCRSKGSQFRNRCQATKSSGFSISSHQTPRSDRKIRSTPDPSSVFESSGLSGFRVAGFPSPTATATTAMPLPLPRPPPPRRLLRLLLRRKCDRDYNHYDDGDDDDDYYYYYDFFFESYWFLEGTSAT